MKELNLRELQLANLEVLKYFAKICEEQGFRYFLTYGTLLGAIRHKGFIPWDDDIDVIMPRPDYNKLIKYCTEKAQEIEPIQLIHYTTNKKYIFPIARLSDKRYSADVENLRDYGLGTYIDIYPYDGCGNDFKSVISIYKKTEPIKRLIFLSGMKKCVVYKRKKGQFIYSVFKQFSFILSKIITSYRLIKWSDKIAQGISLNSNSIAACTAWDNCKKNYIETKEFDDFLLVDFESYKFRVPVGYDALLKRLYGDYMTLPPISEQSPHHNYKIYKKDSAEV